MGRRYGHGNARRREDTVTRLGELKDCDRSTGRSRGSLTEPLEAARSCVPNERGPREAVGVVVHIKASPTSSVTRSGSSRRLTYRVLH